VAPFLNPGAYQKYGLHPPNGVLFHGPPGCGKSYLAEALAKRIAVRFVSVKPGDLASIYVHGTQGMISELFRNARKNAPCVLFLDEFDAMAPKRSAASLSHHYGAEVDELLAQLPDLWKARVLVIAATNQLENLDGAVIRPGRFDLKIWIGPPDLESRTDFFRCELKDRFTEGDLFSDQLALATDGATFSEMKRLLEVAGFAASRKERGITQEDCLAAIKEVLG